MLGISLRLFFLLLLHDQKNWLSLRPYSLPTNAYIVSPINQSMEKLPILIEALEPVRIDASEADIQWDEYRRRFDEFSELLVAPVGTGQPAPKKQKR